MLNFASTQFDTSPEEDNRSLHVVVELGGRPFGVSAAHVIEMLPLPDLTELPNSPAHVRGIIKLRGKVLKTIDLRQCLGLPTTADEVQHQVAQLRQLETDADAWFDELTAAVRSGSTFSGLPEQPQKAFAAWTKTFQAPTLEIEILLHRFDEHFDGLARFAQLARQSPAEAARGLDEVRISHCSPLTELHTETRRLVAEAVREIALVVELDNRRVAITIDNVLGVENLEDLQEAGEQVLTMEGLDAVRGMAIRADGETTLPLLNLEVATGIHLAGV